jgi:hypothetical protein
VVSSSNLIGDTLVGFVQGHHTEVVLVINYQEAHRHFLILGQVCNNLTGDKRSLVESVFQFNKAFDGILGLDVLRDTFLEYRELEFTGNFGRNSLNHVCSFLVLSLSLL